MKREHRKITTEFNAESVRKVSDQRLSLTEVSRKLGNRTERDWAAGNAHPKPAQRPARHSDINLTMSRYSHTLLTDEAAALNALPEFPSAFDSDRPEVQTLEATGTDGRGENVLPSGLPFSDAFRCISMQHGDVPNPEIPTRPKNDRPLNFSKNREKQGYRKRKGQIAV
jgi:hypothetical protein